MRIISIHGKGSVGIAPQTSGEATIMRRSLEFVPDAVVADAFGGMFRRKRARDRVISMIPQLAELEETLPPIEELALPGVREVVFDGANSRVLNYALSFAASQVEAERILGPFSVDAKHLEHGDSIVGMSRQISDAYGM